MTQFNRLRQLDRQPLHTILEPRICTNVLVNGSDYPVAGRHALVRTRPLVKHGYITKEEREHLNEIYDYNPLLFDFALKRTMKLPGTERRLARRCIMTNASLGV